MRLLKVKPHAAPPTPGYPRGVSVPWTKRIQQALVHGTDTPCGYPGSGAGWVFLCLILCLCSACSTNPFNSATVAPEVKSGPVMSGGEIVLPHSQIHFHNAPLPAPEDFQLSANAWTLAGYDSAATRAVTLTACCSGSVPSPLWFHSFGLPLLNAPLISNNRVYILAPDGYLHVLDGQNGAELWRVALGGEMTANGLALANGLVYVAIAGHFIAALDAANGQLRWQFDTGGVVRAAPLVVGKVLLVESGANSLDCLDALTGEEYWVFHSEDALAQFWPTRTPAAVANGLVYVALGASNEFNALDIQTGRKMWEASVQERMTGGPTVDATLGLVYVVTWTGRVLAFDAKSGILRWKAFIPGGSESSPALSLRLNMLYVTGFAGDLYAFAANSGKIVWQSTSGSASVAGATVVQSTEQDWVIVATTGGTCVVVNARNGVHMYNWQLGELRTSPVVANNTLYQASLGKRGLFAIGL